MNQGVNGNTRDPNNKTTLQICLEEENNVITGKSPAYGKSRHILLKMNQTHLHGEYRVMHKVTQPLRAFSPPGHPLDQSSSLSAELFPIFANSSCLCPTTCKARIHPRSSTHLQSMHWMLPKYFGILGTNLTDDAGFHDAYKHPQQ